MTNFLLRYNFTYKKKTIGKKLKIKKDSLKLIHRSVFFEIFFILNRIKYMFSGGFKKILKSCRLSLNSLPGFF